MKWLPPMRETPYDLNLLLIEDNPADVFFLKKMLLDVPLTINNIYEADRLEKGIDLLKKGNVGLTLLDLSLPDSSGLDSLFGILKATNKIPIIILTGLDDTNIALEAIKAGAQDYLVKGEFNKNLLQRAIQYSLERKKQEEKIKESEEKYRLIFKSSPFPSWIYDPATLQFIEVNEAAIYKYGYSYDEFLKLTLKDILPPEDVPELIKSIGSISGAGKLWRHQKKDGDSIMVEVTFYQVTYMGKTAMQAQINDVTEKIQLEAKLEQQQKLRQHQITRAVLRAEEKERRYLGQELHDNINQVLATVKLYLDLCMEGHERKEELIEKSSRNVQTAIEEIRKLSKKLISPDQKTGSLSELLKELVEEISFASRIQFSLDIKELNEEEIEEDLKIAIYRIAQEQLKNILKYAEAISVNIRVYSEDEKLTLIIADDGKGFDLSVPRSGVGIANMTSRAEVFNGKVEIDTAPGKGCILKIIFNLRDQ
jgi:two-component system sensor histidine kinase UhpB